MGDGHELFAFMVDGGWRWMVELVKTMEPDDGWFCWQMNLEVMNLEVMTCDNLFRLGWLEFQL